MSNFAVELLDRDHDRKSFFSGLPSIDLYLKETARSHTEKGVSLTRVLTLKTATAPKEILGYFTLTPCQIEAASWPMVSKGLPKNPVGAVLLGRMGVDISAQGQGIGAIMLSIARRITAESLYAAGGVGMIVDATDESPVPFYEKFGFTRVSPESLRLIISKQSLVS